MYRYIRVAMVNIRDSDMTYVGGVVELVGKCVYPCGSAGRVLRQKKRARQRLQLTGRVIVERATQAWSGAWQS